MKKRNIVLCLLAALFTAACSNLWQAPVEGSAPTGTGGSGKVTIRLAAPAARPLLPENPVFTGYTLDLINRGQVTSVEDVPGINTACVTVELGTGTWIAVVKGFQEIGEVPTVVIERQGT